MKKIWAIATVLLAVLFVTPEVDAKRMGGGKSFGSSFNTAPSQPKSLSSDSGKTTTSAASQPTGTRKSGLMGGILGGLLAGGLIAALMGGAFEGINLIDILLIGAVAFLLFRLLRGARRAKEAAQQQPAYASAAGVSPSAAYQPGEPPVSVSGVADAGSDVPFNLPPGFDLSRFLEEAREHYRILQQAWNDDDLDKIREYVTPELFGQLADERRSLAEAPRTEILYLDVELVRAEMEFGMAQLSLKFSGRCRDGADGREEAINDIWHLQRQLADADTPWRVVGIEG